MRLDWGEVNRLSRHYARSLIDPGVIEQSRSDVVDWTLRLIREKILRSAQVDESLWPELPIETFVCERSSLPHGEDFLMHWWPSTDQIVVDGRRLELLGAPNISLHIAHMIPDPRVVVGGATISPTDERVRTVDYQATGWDTTEQAWVYEEVSRV